MREKKEFNFAQRWVDGLARENERPQKWNNNVLIWGIGSLLLIGILGSAPWLWDYKLARDITLVDQQISALGEITHKVERFKMLNTQVLEQQELLDLLKKSTRDPGPILEKMKKALPVGTVVNTFTLQENSLTLGVNVPTPVDVARLWVSLRDAGMFQDVDIQDVSLVDKTQTLSFNLILK